MKKMGGTKVAALAYGASPASSNAVKSLQKYAVPAAGMDPVYTNTSIDFGSSDVGPLVLGIKNSGADAVDLPMSASTNIAVVQGLEQADVNVKAAILGSGYGQEILDSPASAALGPNDLFFQQTKPAEVNDQAVKKFRADLKNYAKYTGIPGYGHYQGYLAADLLITGLEQAGKTPTCKGFVDGLRKLGTWRAADLTCQPIDISLQNYGKFPKQDCAYYSYVKNGKFVTANNGKPIHRQDRGFTRRVGRPTPPATPDPRHHHGACVLTRMRHTRIAGGEPVSTGFPPQFPHTPRICTAR